MTVKEIIEELKNYPDDTEVFRIAASNRYIFVNSVSCVHIPDVETHEDKGIVIIN